MSRIIKNEMCFLFQTRIGALLLHAGANPDTVTAGGEPLLCWSVRNRQPVMINLLIQFEADVNLDDDNGSTPLHHCAKEGLPEITRILLANGADPNLQNVFGSVPLFFALAGQSWETAEVLLKSSDLTVKTKSGRNALHNVIQWYDQPLGPRALEFLIKAGVDLESRYGNHTALTAAVSMGSVNALQVLIDAGSNINASSNVNASCTRRRSSLAIASGTRICDSTTPELAEGRAQALRMLIDAGANVDGDPNADRTPLESALYSCNLVAVRGLLQSNCSGRISKAKNNYSIVFFMHNALSENARDCASFILSDSCCTEDQHMYYGLSPFYTEEIGLCVPPISLARMCRLVFRSRLPKGRMFLSAVDRLPLPPQLRNFIALRAT